MSLDPRTKDAIRLTPIVLKTLEDKIDEQSIDLAEIVVTLRKIAKALKVKVDLKGLEKLKNKKEEK